jgi:hypothetical protein
VRLEIEEKTNELFINFEKKKKKWLKDYM